MIFESYLIFHCVESQLLWPFQRHERLPWVFILDSSDTNLQIVHHLTEWSPKSSGTGSETWHQIFFKKIQILIGAQKYFCLVFRIWKATLWRNNGRKAKKPLHRCHTATWQSSYGLQGWYYGKGNLGRCKTLKTQKPALSENRTNPGKGLRRLWAGFRYCYHSRFHKFKADLITIKIWDEAEATFQIFMCLQINFLKSISQRRDLHGRISTRSFSRSPFFLQILIDFGLNCI